jgi:hypothetical protein
VTNETGDLQLLGSKHLEGSVEAHEKVVIGVFVEHSYEGLLELRGGEAIGQKHVATGIIRQVLHFQKTNLIQTPSEDIDDMTIVRGALSEVVIELVVC